MIKRMFSNSFIRGLSRQSYSQMPPEIRERIDLERLSLAIEEYQQAIQKLEQLTTKMLAPEQLLHVNGKNANNGHQL